MQIHAMIANIQAAESLLAFSVIALKVLMVIAIELEHFNRIPITHVKIDYHVLVEINIKRQNKKLTFLFMVSKK